MEGVVITIRFDQKEAKKCYENSLKNRRSVSYITTTPPPGVKPKPTEWRVVDAVMEVAAGGDVTMLDAEVEGESGRAGDGRKRRGTAQRKRGNWESPGR